MPACGPVSETAATPLSCSAIASSATDCSSPVASSWSISRGEGSRLTSPASLRSLSVVFPIAETTTTRSRPDSRARPTLSATALMCSAVATELPPYFWTTIPKGVSAHSVAHPPRGRIREGQFHGAGSHAGQAPCSPPGVATLQTREFARWVADLVLVGAVVSILPLPSRALILEVAVACLGFTLLTEKGGCPHGRPGARRPGLRQRLPAGDA